MAGTRHAGDAWHTALYLHPHKGWWAPGLIGFALILGFDYFVLDRSPLESAFPAVVVGGFMAYLSRGHLK